MDQDQLNREVARRLDMLSNQPELMMRYDSNGDGILDREEWEVVRTLVRRQVLDEFQAAREVVEPQPVVDSGDWSQEPLPVDEDALSDEWGVTTDPHIDLTVREKLGERYDVLHELGRGSQASTFLGRDLSNNRFVAIKELAVSKVDDWKSIELFEREQKVLARLEHPGIPAFVDSLDIETNRERRFFIIQEFIDGETLDAELEHVGHFRPLDLRNFAEKVLEVLSYLQRLDPPVFHRDIKPANLIRRANGEVVLVDFGGVQVERADAVGGSTVVGTTGYMPPEQLMGRASKSTDLYALGATLIHLATGHHPSRLPQSRSKLDWRGYASLPEALAVFVDRLVEPIAEDRYASADEALRALPAPTSMETALTTATSTDIDSLERTDAIWTRPPRSFVVLDRSPDALSVRIPARIQYDKIGIGLVSIALPLVALGFKLEPIQLMILTVCFAFAAWNFFMANCSYILEANARGWKIIERFWGIPIEHENEVGIIGGSRVDRRVTKNRNGTENVRFVLQVRANQEWYDVDARLTDEEKNWIASEIDAFAYDAKRVRAALR